MTGKALLIAAGAAALVAAGSANAVTLTEGGGWQVFQWFGGVGSSIGEYTFTVTGAPEKFWIADGYNAGDEFAISINGGPDIATSTSLYNPNVYSPLYYIGDNWNAAFYPLYAPYFSHLSLILPDGTYDITGMVTQDTETNNGIFSCCGSAAVQLTAVPEPSGWALMLLGFGALGVALRHRQKAPAKA
ncbi:MAG TPA: PEPxxWA-CTERM sorting domain-containing protein [Caulobacteraceae bacterium]|nr:PEPxxWA-CTERM sorting domain-containing protein [Caulobacteraceae bacterium]